MVIPGNHDNVNAGKRRNTERYNLYFGPERSDERVWYGGHFRNTNDNNYSLFKVNDLKFLIVGLEFAPSKEALCWADSLVLQYPDRRVIVVTHCYQDHDADHRCDCGTNYDIIGSGGNTTWKEFVRRHSNIFMVLSGHIGDSEFKVRTGNLENTVYKILTDYQFELRNDQYHGNGWLRTLEFFPDENRIDIRVLSVLDDIYEFNRPDYPSNANDLVQNYSIDYDMSSPVEGKYLRLSNTFNDMTIQASDVINQKKPVMDMTENGDFVVAWQDSSSTETVIKVRSFDLSGKLLFSSHQVHPSGDAIYNNPDVAIKSEGQIVVVWEDNSNGTFDIKASAYEKNGTEIFSNILINSEQAGNQTKPKVTFTSDSTFMIVWEDDSNFDRKSEIFITGFNLNGIKQIDDVQVNSQSDGNQRNPELTRSNENVIIAWESDNDSNGLFQINVKELNNTGLAVFPEFTINGNINGQHRNPTIDANILGDFVVAWKDDSDGNGFYQIYAAGYDNSGNKSFGDITVNAIEKGQQLSPSIGLSETGEFRITFQDDNDGNGYYQIFVAGFSASGNRMTETDSTVNENGGGQQLNPKICLNDMDRFVILWEDDINNNGVYETICKGYDYGETYVTPVVLTPQNTLRSFKLYQNHPNPFNNITNIKFVLYKPDNVELVMYNYLGKPVSVIINQYLSPGEYITTWRAGDIASGMYIC